MPIRLRFACAVLQAESRLKKRAVVAIISLFHLMVLPSLLVTSQGRGLIDLSLRASNEGSPRPRVARAQEINRPHPLRVLRARRAPGHSFPILLRVRVPGARDWHGCHSSHRFHLMLQPILAFWFLSTGFPASTASIAARRSRPVTGLLLPGRLSSSCPR